MRYRLPTLLLTALLAQAPGVVADTDEDVNYLLNYIAESGCTFVRNGVRHDPEDAAEHLRAEYEEDRRHIHSAEEFIDRLASASSSAASPMSSAAAARPRPPGTG